MVGSPQKPEQEKRPEGAHETPADVDKGRGSEDEDAAPKSGEKDPQTGELAWKERIKKQTGGG